jgi:transposase
VLGEEIVEHDRLLDRLTEEAAPTLREAFGIGPDVAAEMLIVFGDNPERIHSEAAFAKLCGVCPIPASSGLTNKHRLYRGGAPTSQRRALSSHRCSDAISRANHYLRAPTD